MAGGSEAEADIWECRFRELENIPDLHHVIVEAEVTHRGDPKPLWFHEHADRFKPWAERITYVRVPAGMLPSREENPDPWCREYAQREYCHAGLDEAAPDDIVLHGDADEIPSPGAITALQQEGTAVPGRVPDAAMPVRGGLGAPAAVAWDDPHPGTVGGLVRPAAGDAEQPADHHGGWVAPVMDGWH